MYEKDLRNEIYKQILIHWPDLEHLPIPGQQSLSSWQGWACWLQHWNPFVFVVKPKQHSDGVNDCWPDDRQHFLSHDRHDKPSQHFRFVPLHDEWILRHGWTTHFLFWQSPLQHSVDDVQLEFSCLQPDDHGRSNIRLSISIIDDRITRNITKNWLIFNKRYKCKNGNDLMYSMRIYSFK